MGPQGPVDVVEAVVVSVVDGEEMGEEEEESGGSVEEVDGDVVVPAEDDVDSGPRFGG